MHRTVLDPRSVRHALVETSEHQAAQTVETFARSGLIPRVVCSDELDATIVVGTGPALQRGPDDD